MSKRTRLLSAVLIVTGLLVVAFGGIALAHGPNNTHGALPDGWEQPEWGGHYGYGAFCTDAVSELLGLTHEEIQAQRYDGKSLLEVAAAQGVSEDALIEAILAAKQAIVQERVEAGILTQEQADLMLQQMEQRTLEAITRTTVGPMPDRGFCGYGQAGQSMERGAMRHWGMQGGGMGSDYGTMGFGAGMRGMNQFTGPSG